MASEEEISDIYEIPRPEPAVELEPVSEPKEEEPFMDLEEEPEEDREEDHAIPENAADGVALDEEEPEGDQRIPDQDMGAVEAELKTVMLDLMERNQQLENKVRVLENKAQQLRDGNEELKALWKAERANHNRVLGIEGVELSLRIKKRRLDRILNSYRTNL